MSTRICKWCGKEFEGSGTAKYCKGPHYATCAVCGKEFEVNPGNPNKCCSRECKAKLRKRTIQKQVKTCELCGKEFTSTSALARYCEGPHYRPCPVCGKLVEVERGKEYEPPKCCSAECTNKLREQTCLEKYGVRIASQAEQAREKLHDAAIASEEQRKQTSLQNWGVDNPAKHKAVRAKISATVSSEECQSRMRSTTRSRYGVDFAMQSPEGLERYARTIQEKYGVPYFCMTDKCKESQGHIISAINREFGKRLSAVGISYKFETRIDDKSYDIEILGKNILIEINPSYTHNEVGNHWTTKGISRDYHLAKSNVADQHGYQCIHVFDWDNLDKIVNLVKPKESVYARKCTVVEIDRDTACKFELEHHLQGTCKGQQVCLGLYYQGKLIEVMTFGLPRYNRNYQWELLRLCTNSDYKVLGGATKLFSYFVREYSPDSIISYCDKAKFNGDVYLQLGMSLHHSTEPTKVWSKGLEYITNNLLLQRGYDQLFSTRYGKGTSNEQLMIENGWLPVYDCGQSVYTYTK